MEISSMVLAVSSLIFLFTHPLGIKATSDNIDVKALTALRENLRDPNGELSSWNPNDTDPCLWVHVACNNETRLTHLWLYSLYLTGPIPSELGNLSNLNTLSLTDNYLTGGIPSTLQNATKLEAIWLNSNNLSGSIPPELQDLVYLMFLDVSGNRLTGNIPSFEYNDNMQTLNVSNNNLSGEIPMGGSFKKDAGFFENNPYLCGKIINKTCPL